jgi:methyl-accepting chemotaxis protein
MEESAQGGSIRDASAEVDKARKFLNRFVKTCLETNHWTDRLKDRSAGVATSFGEIVAALQFQDITRQRLEHVQKALRNLAVHLEKFSLRTDFSKDEQAERLFGYICKLQYDQLDYATDEFVSAADKLSVNLQNMSANVVSMAADTKELIRVSDDDNEYRYAVVLHALQSIAEHLEKTGEVHETTVRNLAEVTAGIRKISTLVEEVEFISEEMQLLAINAAISAAHARQKGAGLDIIAQNMQTVAEEASHQAVALSEHCLMITDHAARLQGIEESSQGSSGDVTTLLDEANARLKSFDASHVQLSTLAGQIDGDADALSHEVAMIVSGLHIGEVFRQKIAPVMERFKVLGSDQLDSLSETDSASLDALFRELELCYTMASERKVHKEFVESRQLHAEDNSVNEEDRSEGRQHNLGDNVDLF